ncbi:MAG: hypothetical protein Q9200_001254 [Gallowayella weberi]
MTGEGNELYSADVETEQGHAQKVQETEAPQPNDHDRSFEAFGTNMIMTGAPSQTESSTTMSQKKRARSPDPEEEAHGPPSKLLATGQTITVPQASHPMTDSDEIRGAQQMGLRETETGLEYKHQDHGWIPAVRHDTIRHQLIDDAEKQGKYKFPWGKGLDDDITSFHPDYELWDVTAKDDNPVVSILRSEIPEIEDTAREWHYDRRIVIGSQGTPVLDWHHLPATTSHKIRGLELDGLLLVNKRAKMKDIVDRMVKISKNKASVGLPNIEKFNKRMRTAHSRLLDKEKLIEKGPELAVSDSNGEQEPSGDGTSKAPTEASPEPYDYQIAELYAQQNQDDWRFRAPKHEAEDEELQLALEGTRRAFTARLGGRRHAPETCHTRHYAAQWKLIRTEFAAQWKRVSSVQPPRLWLCEHGEGSGIRSWRLGNLVQDEDLAEEFNPELQDSPQSTP